jgi:hypothetical protein
VVATVIPNGFDFLLFVLVVAGACYLALEGCWRVEEHERRDDEEAW